MEPPRSRTKGGRPDRLPHHISAIAHHFLPAAEEEFFYSRAPALDLAVASSGGTSIGAFVAAGLLACFFNGESASGQKEPNQHLGKGGSVYLHEAEDTRWSAVAYLDSPLRQVQAAQDPRSLLSSGLGSGGSWRVRDAAIPGGSDHESPAREIHVHHLGDAVVSLLEWNDARRALGPGLVPRRGVRTGLVWCIQDWEAGSLARAQILGRLLEALDPDRLEVLVFPDLWPGNDTQGRLERSRQAVRRRNPQSRSDPGKIKELVACLQPSVRVSVTLLKAGGEGKMAVGCSVAMVDVARRLAAPQSPA